MPPERPMSFASFPTVRLKVQQVEQTCLFELTWGDGMQMTTQVPAPEQVYRCYTEWQRAYLGFYKTASLALTTPIQPPIQPSSIAAPGSELRGRAVSSGSAQVTPQTRHSKLIQAEALMLYEFQAWLRSAELYEIRATLAAVSQSQSSPAKQSTSPLTVFLTCIPLALARLPWENWEIGTEFAAAQTLQIVRSPANIRKPSRSTRSERRKPRILAILGDDTGLNFQTDQTAVQSLSRIADVRFVGWQPGQTATQVKDSICTALTDEMGWDVLFFAGHSNETQMTGGELAIAPGTSINLRDLSPVLKIAQDRGLQFALFNSCSGLNVAESLIDMGFSQVAVMREPIHNRVAQEFLVQFFQALAAHEDVQMALRSASQFLESEKSFDFPSSHLIPSLFCHPGASLFRIPPAGWRQALSRAIPNRYEAIALAGCLTLAWLTPVQDWMLDQRIAIQARYRVMTHQLATNVPPPVALVQIDRESINRSVNIEGFDGIDGININPMDRRYLAAVLDAMIEHDAHIIGIDYLLDTVQIENDSALAQSVQTAVAQDAWLVFAALRQGSGSTGVLEQTQITHSTWSLEGIINVYPHILTLLNPGETCRQNCPLGYVLSLIDRLEARSPDAVLSPASRIAEWPPEQVFNASTDTTTDTALDTAPGADPETLNDQLIDQIEQDSPNHEDLAALYRFRYHPLSVWAANTLKQFWLLPVIDYSIPPSQVYVRIPAWTLLEPNAPDTPAAVRDLNLSEQIVILGSNYPQAGIEGEEVESDRFPPPTGYTYWFRKGDQPDIEGLEPSPSPRYITGAEFHAYNTHHFLTQHRVVSIPAFWVVGIVAIASKSIAFSLRRWNPATSQAAHLGSTRGANLPGIRFLSPLTLFLPQIVRRSAWKQRQVWIAGTTSLVLAGYGLASLQLYIAAQIILPWVLPSIVVWAYILPTLRRKER